MFKNQDFEIVTHEGYDRIIPKRDKLYPSGNPGEPEIPVYFANFIIPPGREVTEVILGEVDMRQVPGTYSIYPLGSDLLDKKGSPEPPGPYALGKGWFQEPVSIKFRDPDSSIYGSDSLWPGMYLSDSTNDGFFDGATIASVAVYPFQYRPLSGRLYLVKKITFSLVLTDATIFPDRPAIRSPRIQPLYLAAMETLVDNPSDVPAWYIQPAASENTWDCVVVASGCVLETNALDLYIEWLWERGYRTKVVNVQDLNLGGNGEALQSYIKDWWQNEGTSFVHLAGISVGPDEIPAETLWLCEINGNIINAGWGVPFADILYSSLCDWDYNGDGILGTLYRSTDGGQTWHMGPDYKSVDFFPEVFVGRVPIMNCDIGSVQVSNWVEKVMTYEQNPGNANRLTWLTAIERGDQTGYYDNFVQDYLPPHINLQENINGIPQSVMVDLNTKDWGWIDIHCKGSWWLFEVNEFSNWPWEERWLISYPDWSGYEAYIDLSELTNTDRYFIVYDIADYNAYYGFGLEDPTLPSIMEGFTNYYADRGATAFLGLIREGRRYVGSLGLTQAARQHGRFYWWLYGLSDVHRTAWRLLGPPEAFSKQKGLVPVDLSRVYMSYMAYSHNLYGSPLTPVWTKDNPGRLTAEHPIIWTDGIGAPFRVKVKHGNQPVKNAMVTLLLYSGDYPTGDNVNVYARALTGPNGVATFRIAPTISGVMKVTATKHDYLPYLGICQVSEGKVKRDKDQELLPEKMEITAPTASTGNCSVLLAIPFENEGQVSLILYDATGRLSLKVYEGHLEAGYHEFNLNKKLSSGIYFLRLETSSESLTRKLVIK